MTDSKVRVKLARLNVLIAEARRELDAASCDLTTARWHALADAMNNLRHIAARAERSASWLAKETES